ncbi:twin-arginine translocation signal domain-containing protein [Spirosoma fluminis]
MFTRRNFLSSLSAAPALAALTNSTSCLK